MGRILLLSVALVAALSFGCASGAPRELIAQEMQKMRDALPKEIRDPERAGRVRQSVDGLEGELLALEAANAEFKAGFRALNARTDATRAEFDAFLDRFDGERRTLRDRILDRHFELIAGTTPGEWKALSGYEREALIASGRRQ